MKEVIFHILTFFFMCDPEAPYGLARADVYINNKELFDKRIKYFTKKFADPSLPYKKYKNWDFSLPDELKSSYDF